LAELAPSYEVAFAYLIHILEARFASLNPFMQCIFLKLHEIEDPEKKAFILETLRIEFRDIAIEARKVLRNLISMAHLLKLLVHPMKILECQYLVNLREFMMLWKRILVGFDLKTFLMKVVYQRVIIKGL
jgi:hypothetical protein